MRLKDFIPPIVTKVSHLRSQPSTREYASYEVALADSDTYEDSDLIEVVSRKTAAYRSSLASRQDRVASSRQTVQNMLALLCAAPDEPICVLELGGACGASYFELSYLLPEKIKSWFVVETQGMAATGRRLFQDETLKFFDDLGAAASEIESRDLIISQGVLQYTPDPLQTLDAMVALGFKYLYVTRTTVRAAPDDGRQKPLIIKQGSYLSDHGPGAFPDGFADRKINVPHTIISREAIAHRVSNGYNVLFWFDEAEGAPLFLESSTIETKAVGFLAARRTAAPNSKEK